jgi:UDP-glucose 4-epimerase
MLHYRKVCKHYDCDPNDQYQQEASLKRILITGSSGLVGSHLVPLLAGKFELHLVGRIPTVQMQDGIVHHALDLGQEFSIADFPANIDAVVYLAQSDKYRDFPAAALDVFSVNVAAPMRLVDFARRAGARQFIYASSGGVYGGGDQPLPENTPIAAGTSLGFYTASKYAAEMMLRTYASVLDIVVLRLFFAYGKGQKRQMLLPRLIDQIRDGVPIALQGESGIRINPIHASDAAQAVKAALSLKSSHTINVAGPDAWSLRDICEEIGRHVGRAPDFSVKPAAKDLVADTYLMNHLLHIPSCALAEGIRDLVVY